MSTKYKEKRNKRFGVWNVWLFLLQWCWTHHRVHVYALVSIEQQMKGNRDHENILLWILGCLLFQYRLLQCSSKSDRMTASQGRTWKAMMDPFSRQRFDFRPQNNTLLLRKRNISRLQWIIRFHFLKKKKKMYVRVSYQVDIPWSKEFILMCYPITRDVSVSMWHGTAKKNVIKLLEKKNGSCFCLFFQGWYRVRIHLSFFQGC